MSMQECLGSWLNSFGKEDKKLVLVGISAICWALWKARNGVIFENKRISDPMTIIKAMTHWMVDWSILQIREQQKKGAGAGGKTARTGSKRCLRGLSRVEN
uniref:Uncharacterized protein n=1 Tax=Aegilops tauschii subsp. strangulata TaxID=200361 RepID=A0A452YGX2_AEGTS